MNLYYVTFSKTKRPTEFESFALIGSSADDVLGKALSIGDNPTIVAGPYQLNRDWDVAGG